MTECEILQKMSQIHHKGYKLYYYNIFFTMFLAQIRFKFWFVSTSTPFYVMSTFHISLAFLYNYTE